MPLIVTKTHLYKIYVESLQETYPGTTNMPVAKSTFISKFPVEFKHVIFPRELTLGVCDTCSQAKEQMANKKASSITRRHYKERLQEHVILVTGEKKVYTANQIKAENEPERYMSIIMDGASDAILPFRLPKPKAWNDLHLYPLGVHGIINHGLKKRYLYLHQGQFGCGPDFAITILHHHLSMVFSTSTKRPSTLFLQLDNCSHENKNKYMLAYCHWLVKCKVFRKIKISFLPVGHTHADVDQMFSVLKNGMKHKSRVTSVQDLIQNLSEWYPASSCPTPIFLFEAWAFKPWLLPFIRDPEGTSKPHVFKISIDDSDTVTMYTKDYASLPSRWKGPCYFMKHFPTDAPDNLDPGRLDDQILKDTLSALSVFHNSKELQLSFKDIVHKFNNPPVQQLLTNPFNWVHGYQYPSVRPNTIPPLHRLIDPTLYTSAMSPYEIEIMKPDIGAIAAFAGEDCSQFWLGKILRVTTQTATVKWLEEDEHGCWKFSLLKPVSVKLTSIIHPDVSLGLDKRLRLPLKERLLTALDIWFKEYNAPTKPDKQKTRHKRKADELDEGDEDEEERRDEEEEDQITLRRKRKK